VGEPMLVAHLLFFKCSDETRPDFVRVVDQPFNIELDVPVPLSDNLAMDLILCRHFLSVNADLGAGRRDTRQLHWQSPPVNQGNLELCSNERVDTPSVLCLCQVLGVSRIEKVWPH
jgi:hypothetical protein